MIFKQCFWTKYYSTISTGIAFEIIYQQRIVSCSSSSCLLLYYYYYYYYYDLISQGSSKKKKRKKKTLSSSSSSQLEVYPYFLLCDTKAQSICSFDKQSIGNTMHSHCYPLIVAIAVVAIVLLKKTWKTFRCFVESN